MGKDRLIDEITAIAYAQGFIEAKANREDIVDELQDCIYMLTDIAEGKVRSDRGGCVNCRHIQIDSSCSPCCDCTRNYIDRWESE